MAGTALKLAVGSDERTALTDLVMEELKKRGHQVEALGSLKGEPMGGPAVGGRGRQLGERVSGMIPTFWLCAPGAPRPPWPRRFLMPGSPTNPSQRGSTL